MRCYVKRCKTPAGTTAYELFYGFHPGAELRSPYFDTDVDMDEDDSLDRPPPKFLMAAMRSSRYSFKLGLCRAVDPPPPSASAASQRSTSGGRVSGSGARCAAAAAADQGPAASTVSLSPSQTSFEEGVFGSLTCDWFRTTYQLRPVPVPWARAITAGDSSRADYRDSSSSSMSGTRATTEAAAAARSGALVVIRYKSQLALEPRQMTVELTPPPKRRGACSNGGCSSSAAAACPAGVTRSPRTSLMGLSSVVRSGGMQSAASSRSVSNDGSPMAAPVAPSNNDDEEAAPSLAAGGLSAAAGPVTEGWDAGSGVSRAIVAAAGSTAVSSKAPWRCQNQQGASQQTAVPVCLENNPPHWHVNLRCWCLDFGNRVKLASVKNFQLRVQVPKKSESESAAAAAGGNNNGGASATSAASATAGLQQEQNLPGGAANVAADAQQQQESSNSGGGGGSRIVMQHGKVDDEIYVLDFDPRVLTAAQAFAVSVSSFERKCTPW